MADPIEMTREAAEMFSKTWEAALEKDIPLDLVAGTAMSAAISSLVRLHGPEAAARMMDHFATAIRAGRFEHIGGQDNGHEHEH